MFNIDKEQREVFYNIHMNVNRLKRRNKNKKLKTAIRNYLILKKIKV